MSEVAAYGMDKKEGGALSELDFQLERLDQSLSDLGLVVAPITNQYDSAEVALSAPRPEPRSNLHGKVYHLAELVDRLQTITREIVL